MQLFFIYFLSNAIQFSHFKVTQESKNRLYLFLKDLNVWRKVMKNSLMPILGAEKIIFDYK